MVHPLGWAKRNQLDIQIEDLNKRLKKAQRISPEKPTAQKVAEWQTARDRLSESQRLLMDYLDPRISRLPGSAEEASLYCIERYHAVSKQLQRQALGQGVQLVQDIGMRSELPNQEEVATYLRRLETIERVVGSLLDQRFFTVDLIKPLETQTYAFDGDGSPELTELPLQIVATGTTEGLVRFLYDLQEGAPLVLVRQLRVRKLPESLLQMQVTLSEFVLDRVLMTAGPAVEPAVQQEAKASGENS